MPPKPKPLAPPTITEQLAEGCPSPFSPLPRLLEDVKSIKTSLAVLQKVITPGAQTRKPPPSKTPENAPIAPVARAKGKTHTPTFASATASLPRPSLMVGLDFLNWNKGRPSLAVLCAEVTAEDRAKTPDECHAALVSDKPAYASIIITQKPSWVHDPN
ncbi:hypothetical protein EI94DRAFT_1705796 [Lactarius quietus]|nr:hypothetical protein EI94DRAFT_1705796 [Lactarius quietus]